MLACVCGEAPPLSLSTPLFVSPSLHFMSFLFLSLSLSFPLSYSRSLSFSPTLPLSLPSSLPPFLPPFLPPSISIYPSLPPSLTLSLPRSPSRSLSFPISNKEYFSDWNGAFLKSKYNYEFVQCIRLLTLNLCGLLLICC